MTYQTIGGPGVQGGFGYYGLGADYPIGAKSEEINAMQRELQRLNFLGAGTERFGADGYWGPRTASGLQAAARYIGYESAAYQPANADQLQSGEVTVPDDLLDRLRAASPAPAGTPGVITGAADPQGPVSPGPEDTTTLVTQTTQAPSNWVPAAVIGGGVLLVGGWMWYSMRPKKRVRANRKRRRRRRRR